MKNNFLIRIAILCLVVTVLQLSSRTNSLESAHKGTIEETTEVLLGNDEIIQNEGGEDEKCDDCWGNPYVDDVEGDPVFLKNRER